MRLGLTVNRDGKISVGILVLLILLAAAVYAATQFAPPYISYYMFKDEVEAEAEGAHRHSDQVILRHIMEEVRQSGLPIEEKDIVIERRESEIEISTHYKVDLNFFNRYYKTLFFDIDAVKPIKTK